MKWNLRYSGQAGENQLTFKEADWRADQILEGNETDKYDKISNWIREAIKQLGIEIN